MMEAGEIYTRVGIVLPLAAAQDAREMLGGTQRRSAGKIVSQVAG